MEVSLSQEVVASDNDTVEEFVIGGILIKRDVKARHQTIKRKFNSIHLRQTNVFLKKFVINLDEFLI
jgi:hypothetical protein